MTYFLIFLFQFLFNIAKTFEIKYTYENQIVKLLINTIILNTLALASTYYSIDYLFKGNIIVIIFFILGSVVGKWFAMTHFENYRAKILNMFKEK
jgi:hypothetical protein